MLLFVSNSVPTLHIPDPPPNVPSHSLTVAILEAIYGPILVLRNVVNQTYLPLKPRWLFQGTTCHRLPCCTVASPGIGFTIFASRYP